MKQLIITILIVLLSQTFSFSQTDTTSLKQEKFKHSVGFAVGLTTGYGLSYRYAFDKFEVQLAFAPIKNSYETRINTGLTFFYKLVETKYTTFFLYQGNSYTYSKSTYYLFKENEMESYDEETIEEHNFNNGIGIGIRFIILKRVGLQFMAGYASIHNFQEINFTGETGVYFRF